MNLNTHRDTGTAADWPRPRRDASLTGRCPVPGVIRKPQVVATLNLEADGAFGRPGAERVVTCDVNGDGTDELLSHEAGRLVARGTGGRMLWRSEQAGLELLAIHNLTGGEGAVPTGAGVRLSEMHLIVVYAERTLEVLSGGTGAVLWRRAFQDPAVCLNQQNVRVGKMVPGLSGEQITIWPEGDDRAYLYAFDQGVEHGRLVWETQGIGKGEMTRYRANVLVSMPEMGRNHDETDIIVVEHTFIWACRAADGVRRWELSGPKMRNYGFAGLFDVDNDGVRELVLVNTNVQLHLSVIKIEGDKARYLWDVDLGMVDFVMSSSACPVEDVDDDGKVEIYYSLASLTKNIWRVEVRDAVTSALKRSIEGCRALDAADFDGDGRTEILVENPVDGAWWLERSGGADERSKAGAVAGAEFAGGVDAGRAAHFGAVARGETGAAARPVARVEVADRLDRTWKPFWERSRFALPQSPAASGRTAAGTATVEAADGSAIEKDSERIGLRATASAPSDGIGPRPQSPVAHARRNCPAAVPLVADINDDGVCEVVVGRSAYRLDGGSWKRLWTLAIPPERVPQRSLPVGTTETGRYAAALCIADVNGDGKPEIVLNPEGSTVALLDHRGGILWEARVKGDFYGGGVSSCVAGNFRRGTGADICVNAFSADLYRNELVLLDGRSGREIWRRKDGHDSGLGPVDGYLGIRPLQDDGLDDLLFLSGEFVLGLDGADGRDLIRRRELSELLGTRWVGSGSLVFFDLDEDGNDEVILSGIWGVNAGALDWDGSTFSARWHGYYGNESNIQSPPRWRHQGLARGPAGLRIGGQSFDYRFSCYDARGGKLLWSHDLTGAATGEIVSGDVDGDGDDEFVFGTSNGTLYILGYDGAERARLDLDAPVGSPVIADINGDGRPEIVVCTNDGVLSVIADGSAAR